ncbi:MAG: uroporphyrinogen decarboxylase family protein [Pirellulaceae bacterium]
MIERYLDDLERRIDPEVESDLHAKWVRFTDGGFDGDVFTPGRPAPSPPGVEWPEVRVNETLENFEKMALQQFARCSATLAEGGGNLLCVRCNYGTGILPSLFGPELFVMPDETNTLPTVRPLEGGKEAVRELVGQGAPDIHAGLAGRVFEMAEFFLDIMDRYPNIGAHVHLYHPDTQGPMDICELLWGSDLFVDIMDEPELVHELLSLVTETYVRFMHEWRKLVPFEDDHNPHWGMMHGGRIMLRDDSAMNFSPAMFDDFIRPYDQRLLDEFGGGAVHFCGKGDHYIDLVAEIPGVRAVHMSQPEYNDMETILRHTVDRDIRLIGLRPDAARQALGNDRELHGNVHATAEPTP